MEFIRQKPLEIPLLGTIVKLVPVMAPGGECSYKSEPLEFWIPTPDGRYRIRGRIILKAPHSKGWDVE